MAVRSKMEYMLSRTFLPIKITAPLFPTEQKEKNLHPAEKLFLFLKTIIPFSLFKKNSEGKFYGMA